MAKTVVPLVVGWLVGETLEKEVELRAPKAGDIIDAAVESEKLVATPDGYQLVQSPTLAGINTLRRQIERIGSYDGPVTLNMLRALDPIDLAALQEASTKLSNAALESTQARGRDDRPGAAAGP